MAKGQLRGTVVIQNNISDVLHFLVSGNRNRGQQRLMANGSIDGDDSLNPTRHQYLRVAAQELRIVAMGDRQEKVIVLAEIGFDPAANHPAVYISNLFRDDTDSKAALYTQRSRKEIGAVIQFTGGIHNACAGVCRDGTRRWRIVQDGGNR